MTEHSTQTTTLNTLIGTLLDSVDGYTKAAQDIHDPQLGQRFNARARERQGAVAELQAAVARLGGNSEDDSTLLGGAHRVFVDLKAAVTGRDDQAILKEVERGEDYLKGKFETALNSGELQGEARTAVQNAWNSVKSGHDEMSQLKHTREGYEQGRQDAQQQAYAQSGQASGQQQPGQAQSGQQQYATDTAGTTGTTAAPGTQGGHFTGADGYQQDGGGYPGTISPNDGSGSTVR